MRTFYNMGKSEGLQYKDILEHLEKQKPLTFSRFGDGEWAAILKERGENVDGCKYYPELGEALGDVLKKKPAYHLAMMNFARETYGSKIENWLNINKLEIYWNDSDILHKAAYDGELFRMFRLLNRRDVVMVAPKYMDGLQEYFYFRHVIIPEKDAFFDLERICVETRRQTGIDSVVLLCAGMTSNIIIDRLHDGALTLIDCGAIFDPFAGVKKRQYHKLDIVQRNER